MQRLHKVDTGLFLQISIIEGESLSLLHQYFMEKLWHNYMGTGKGVAGWEVVHKNLDVHILY